MSCLRLFHNEIQRSIFHHEISEYFFEFHGEITLDMPICLNLSVLLQALNLGLHLILFN